MTAPKIVDSLTLWSLPITTWLAVSCSLSAFSYNTSTYCNRDKNQSRKYYKNISGKVWYTAGTY